MMLCVHPYFYAMFSPGHSFFGRCGGDGVMQISVRYMKDIQVDINCKENALGCITTQSGVLWAEAYKAVTNIHHPITRVV